MFGDNFLQTFFLGEWYSIMKIVIIMEIHTIVGEYGNQIFNLQLVLMYP